MLIEKIKKDLTIAMKQYMTTRRIGYKNVVDALRMVIGEVPRLNLKKDQQPTDEQVLTIIKKLIKSENLVCEYSGQDACDNDFIIVLEAYLPQMMSQDEIISWVKENIDFSKYDIPVKAMGEIMKQLKGKVDGKLVKDLLDAKQ